MTMYEVKYSGPWVDLRYRISEVGDVDYIEVGKWVSKYVFNVIVDDMKKEGKAIPFYDGVAIFEDDKMVKIKKNGKFEEVE